MSSKSLLVWCSIANLIASIVSVSCSQHLVLNWQYLHFISGQTKGLDKITMGRKKIFNILKYLKSEEAIVEKPKESNRKSKPLYPNNDHPLVFVPSELE